jgi:hypothetical protein
MATHEEIKAAGGNDVGDWGDKGTPAYSEPFRINGEVVDLDALPAFGDDDPTAAGEDKPRERETPQQG